MSRSDDGEPESDEDVVQLLKLASPRPALNDEALTRLRASAHEGWRRAVRRRRAWSWALPIGLLSAAAAAALAWALDLPFLLRRPVELTTVADVVYVSGDLREVSPRARAGGAPLRSGDRLWVGAEIATTKGRASLVWQDGAHVRLDEGTRVHVEPEGFALVGGALYVDTVPALPLRSRLVVTTPLGSTRHLGTRYEVRLLGARLRVRVREGRVQLEREGRPHVAAAGEELSVQEGGDVSMRAVPVFGPDWGWVTAAGVPFRLEGRSARALLDWAAAEGGWTLQFADPSAEAVAAQAMLHGRVEGLSPVGALAVVLPTCGLEHRLDGGRLVVQRSAKR